jgi:hypothetical protein
VVAPGHGSLSAPAISALAASTHITECGGARPPVAKRCMSTPLLLCHDEQRLKLVKADATAKAIDSTLSNCRGLTRFLDDGDVPIDNNHLENQMRTWALGRNKANSVFMRSRRGTWRRVAQSAVATPVRSRAGLCIRSRVSCVANPTSGDRDGCLRFAHGPGRCSTSSQCFCALRSALLGLSPLQL